MSYELCVFRPGYAADLQTAKAVWNDEKYWASSLPDHDSSAAKWHMKDLLLAFDDRLHWTAPEAPATGLFAKWFGKPVLSLCYLHVHLDYENGQTSFDLFDQAIEISLPWESPPNEVEKLVRELWRFLEHLSAAGWSTIYDIENEVLLNLETDFDAVLARYRENLAADATDEAQEGPAPQAGSKPPSLADEPQSVTAASKSAVSAAAKSDKPFTGNVD